MQRTTRYHLMKNCAISSATPRNIVAFYNEEIGVCVRDVNQGNSEARFGDFSPSLWMNKRSALWANSTRKQKPTSDKLEVMQKVRKTLPSSENDTKTLNTLGSGEKSFKFFIISARVFEDGKGTTNNTKFSNSNRHGTRREGKSKARLLALFAFQLFNGCNFAGDQWLALTPKVRPSPASQKQPILFILKRSFNGHLNRLCVRVRVRMALDFCETSHCAPFGPVLIHRGSHVFDFKPCRDVSTGRLFMI